MVSVVIYVPNPRLEVALCLPWAFSEFLEEILLGDIDLSLLWSVLRKVFLRFLFHLEKKV